MQVMKRMLNTPKMDRNKAASPNLALPSSSLNRTCQREEEVRRALDPLFVGAERLRRRVGDQAGADLPWALQFSRLPAKADEALKGAADHMLGTSSSRPASHCLSPGVGALHPG